MTGFKQNTVSVNSLDRQWRGGMELPARSQPVGSPKHSFSLSEVHIMSVVCLGGTCRIFWNWAPVSEEVTILIAMYITWSLRVELVSPVRGAADCKYFPYLCTYRKLYFAIVYYFPWKWGFDSREWGFEFVNTKRMQCRGPRKVSVIWCLRFEITSVELAHNQVVHFLNMQWWRITRLYNEAYELFMSIDTCYLWRVHEGFMINETCSL